MQNSKKIILGISFACCLMGQPSVTYAQQSSNDTLSLSVDRLFELVIQNNPTLKVAAANIDVAEQNVRVAKNNLLPSANTSVSAFYLSDVDIFSTKFQKQFTQDLPNFGNNAGVEANQLIWKGGQVRESIKLSELQVDIAGLQYTSNEQQARLAALGYYLDLFKLYNQSRVYAQNIKLAEQRATNIDRFAQQGMVTRNDVIRGDLMISNLQLSKLTVDNNIVILNKQLNVALGLPGETIIYPNEDILSVPLALENELNYQQSAVDNNPNVLLTKKAVDIGTSSVKIAKKNWYPALAAFAGNTFQRPLTTATPALDMYYNTWNAGLALSFDVGSLWKNKRVVSLRTAERDKLVAQQQEVEALIGIGVKSAYIKHGEALIQKSTLATNKDLADENYRIMEKKYNNQLAIIIDLIDAANAKLDSELQYANAEINIIYAYYRLLKETGKI